jgi:biotin carboxylase
MRFGPAVVVGTTPDYVARIHGGYRGPVLFLLDNRFMGHPLLKTVSEEALIFVQLEDIDETLRALRHCLSRRKMEPQGIACYDCESLVLASSLAEELGKPFPPIDAVIHARNKFESRRRWKEAGLKTPLAAMVSGLKETLEFFDQVSTDIVLKPISGSGSELVFHCENKEDVAHSVHLMEEQLPKRRRNELFREFPASGTGKVDPCASWIVEEFIPGPEFSCDCFLQDDRLTILRETGKVKASDQTFGTVLAYTLPPSYPTGFSPDTLREEVKRAAIALGAAWGHFMVDFIVREGEAVIIEMTPRPGGDSIPELLEAATGQNMLGLHLDIVSGRTREFITPRSPREFFASIHLYAPRAGTITGIDPSAILRIPWVRSFHPKKGPGDRVTLPPEDYDNRVLGFCIITPEPDWDLVSVGRDLQSRLGLSMEGQEVGGRPQ